MTTLSSTPPGSDHCSSSKRLVQPQICRVPGVSLTHDSRPVAHVFARSSRVPKTEEFGPSSVAIVNTNHYSTLSVRRSPVLSEHEECGLRRIPKTFTKTIVLHLLRLTQPRRPVCAPSGNLLLTCPTTKLVTA